MDYLHPGQKLVIFIKTNIRKPENYEHYEDEGQVTKIPSLKSFPL